MNNKSQNTISNILSNSTARNSKSATTIMWIVVYVFVCECDGWVKSSTFFFSFFFLIYENFFCFCFVCHHELNVFLSPFFFLFYWFQIFLLFKKKSSYSNCNFGLHSTYFLLFCLLSYSNFNENLLSFSIQSRQ